MGSFRVTEVSRVGGGMGVRLTRSRWYTFYYKRESGFLFWAWGCDGPRKCLDWIRFMIKGGGAGLCFGLS